MNILKVEKTLVLIFFISLVNFINHAQGLKCYQCDSEDNEDCIKDITKIPLTECVADKDSCITKFDNKKIIRSCAKSNPVICSGTYCSECKENGCNTNIICAKCDSASNENCITASKYLSVICPSGRDKCITQVKDDKTIERKCVSSATTCDYGKTKTCEVCDKSYCNKDLFPKDRKSCYQCKGSNCNDLKESQLNLCPLYEENEECYMFGISEKDMNRGCLSDVGNKCSSSETESNGKCVTCDENGCNKQKYSREPSRKCFQGESSSEEAKACKKPLEYWKTTEECFIQKSADGKIISRGCVNDRAVEEKPCNAENLCKSCETDGCNTDDEGGSGGGGGGGGGGEGSGSGGGTGSGEFQCIRCRSSNPGEEWCRDEIKNKTGEMCRNQVNSGEEGCFIDRWNDGTIIRGCLVDYDEKSRKDCNNDAYKLCQSCNEANCNTGKAPNGVSGLRATIALLVVSILALSCVI